MAAVTYYSTCTLYSNAFKRHLYDSFLMFSNYATVLEGIAIVLNLISYSIKLL